jgi:hypothetical protein
VSWTLYPAKIGNPTSPAIRDWLSTNPTVREIISLSEDEDGIVDRYRWAPRPKKEKVVKEKRGRKGPNIDEDFVGVV